MAATKLLLIDGHSMAYRAFFALPVENFATAQGQHTNAIYGFTTMLLSLLKEEKPTHIAVAFDVSRKTFRTDIYPEYKANRAKTPDEFRSQISYLHELLAAFGISQFELEGYEADDLIATITRTATAQGMDVLICTGDRDSFQLVNPSVTVLYPKKGVSELARMTPEAVVEKYGMTPEQYPDFAALRGDPSDNLPSIPGVGEKTAAKWINEFGSLKALVESVDQIPGKAGESLRASLDNVIRNRELTQLVHDAPIVVNLENLVWHGIDESAVLSLFTKLEFKSLKDRIKGIPLSGESAPLELFTTTIEAGTVSADELSLTLKSHQGPIAIACEFENGALHRYAVALSAQEVFVVASPQIGPWVADGSLSKIMFDAKELGRITPLHGVIFDAALANYLVNPGVRIDGVVELSQKWGGAVDESTPEKALATAATSLFEIKANLEVELAEKQLLKLFHEIEMPIMRLLSTMESIGIAVDTKELHKLFTTFESVAQEATAQAHAAAGHEFNVASPKQLQVVLFEELKLPKTKKIKTGYTTDADSLHWLFEKTQHPLLASLLRIRETKKLASIVEGLINEVASDGRIHTHFGQTVAATGRLSSIAPNLQNIPVRTQEGRTIRDCFIAGDGYESLLTADYSQIELRIMAHLSQDKKLLEAFASGEDLHATVAAEVFGVAPTEVDAEMRRQIKAMSYGLAYGLSAYGLAAQLDISAKDAQSLMDRYFERFGGIRDYLQTVVEEARKVGYTETIMGRRRYLPDLNHGDRQRREVAERMALNAPMQGSAADIIKLAMLNVDRALTSEGCSSRLLLQVHDELIFEIAPGEEAKMRTLVAREMGNAYPLDAPLDVNIGVGKSWNQAAH